jgi:TPP-dependent pyruvate/acetoin dehydrogenase alpha subunit
MALAEKQNNTGAVAISFIGDGTFGEGAIYEAFNIAALWKLPVLFVVEHNQYAQSTPSQQQHAGKLNTRVDTFGIPVTTVDGNDVMAVYNATSNILASIRTNFSPQMLFLETYRLGPHSKGDDFREVSEINAHKNNDPILLLSHIIGKELSQSIDASAKSKVDLIVKELSCG